ncbi:uncharacterized protein P884DRAFT_289363 [Thermothelomyces heterothallicus CBS 202.75]|uniref:uncharacterized protein n=1 Tax=Thermothelomyces heterothallicus CBS 202.75 TaxID=1149848 RepID=UPI0037439840
MKNIAVFVLLGHAALAQAEAWWEGAPECAYDCFNSWWSSAIAWPAPTSYCSANQGASVSNCLRTACSATPTAVTSYSSLSASLCSRWSSCSSAGSTGVYTITAPAFTGRWPDFDDDHDWDGLDWDDLDWNDHDDDDDWDDLDRFRSRWSQFTRTWTGGVYTVTGCEWDGNVWAGGPWGYGIGGAAGSPWGPWGSGWRVTTVTQTITRVVRVTSSGGATSLSTSVGPGLVALAVSGDVTSTSVVGAAETTGTGTAGNSASATGGSGGGSVPDAAAALARDGALGVKVAGAVLGGVIAVAALL